MKDNKYIYELLWFLIPLAMAMMFVRVESFVFAALAVLVALLLVLALPLCRSRENMWALIVTSFVTLPINIKGIFMACDALYLDLFSSFATVTIAILLLFILYSVEQIIFGVAIRVIRPMQIGYDS